MSYLIFGVLGFFIIAMCFILKNVFRPFRVKNIENRHVVVTGGSSGIGKSVAIIAAQNGAHVTIIARNIQNLKIAKVEIVRACKNPDTQKIQILPMDITDDYRNVESALLDLDSSFAPIYMLVNCAGSAVCGKIEDTTPETLQHMINLNFMATYNCIKAVVPRMKAAKEGIIVLTSSQAALIGISGLSAYCSAKFALRGLAESLNMEMFPHNISVTLALPPDTDTPGFEAEQKSKPLETKLISECGGLFSPDEVAKKLFDDALASKFFSTVGMEGFILCTLCAGMSPFTSWCEVLLQSMLMGIMRIISGFYLMSFHRIILNCIETRDKNKKST